MPIESRFDLIDSVISAMRGQCKNMPDIITGVDNPRKNVPDITHAESDMGAGTGVRSHGGLFDLDSVPVRMTNLLVAAQTYEANVGLLGRYKQMTETKLELLG
jgi:hypothetical protein